MQAGLTTYTQWSEGTGHLYAVLGAGWPPTGLRQADVQDTGAYSVEPALAVTGARMLSDGTTVCLTTGQQVSGAAYQVRYVPQVTLPSAPLEGFPEAPVLTAVAVDATHVVVVPDVHHLTGSIDWASASTYQLEPALAVQAAAPSADGRVVRLTTAVQNTSADYTLKVGGTSTTVVR